MSSHGHFERAAVAVRFVDMGAATHGATVRFSLSTRDIYAGAQARAWLLRVAVLARGSIGRAPRSQSRSRAQPPIGSRWEPRNGCARRRCGRAATRAAHLARYLAWARYGDDHVETRQ